MSICSAFTDIRDATYIRVQTPPQPVYTGSYQGVRGSHPLFCVTTGLALVASATKNAYQLDSFATAMLRLVMPCYKGPVTCHNGRSVCIAFVFVLCDEMTHDESRVTSHESTQSVTSVLSSFWCCWGMYPHSLQVFFGSSQNFSCQFFQLFFVFWSHVKNQQGGGRVCGGGARRLQCSGVPVLHRVLEDF